MKNRLFLLFLCTFNAWHGPTLQADILVTTHETDQQKVERLSQKFPACKYLYHIYLTAFTLRQDPINSDQQRYNDLLKYFYENLVKIYETASDKEIVEDLKHQTNFIKEELNTISKNVHDLLSPHHTLTLNNSIKLPNAKTPTQDLISEIRRFCNQNPDFKIMYEAHVFIELSKHPNDPLPRSFYFKMFKIATDGMKNHQSFMDTVQSLSLNLDQAITKTRKNLSDAEKKLFITTQKQFQAKTEKHNNKTELIKAGATRTKNNDNISTFNKIQAQNKALHKNANNTSDYNRWYQDQFGESYIDKDGNAYHLDENGGYIDKLHQYHTHDGNIYYSTTKPGTYTNSDKKKFHIDLDGNMYPLDKYNGYIDKLHQYHTHDDNIYPLNKHHGYIDKYQKYHDHDGMIYSPNVDGNYRTKSGTYLNKDGSLVND